MSAIENAIERVIEYHDDNCSGGTDSPCNLSVDSRAELAALRATAAEVTALQQAVNEARKVMIAWHVTELNELGEDIFPLMKSIDEIDLYESGDDLLMWAQELRRDWLVNNPAPVDHVHLADQAGGHCVICGTPAPEQVTPC